MAYRGYQHEVVVSLEALDADTVNPRTRSQKDDGKADSKKCKRLDGEAIHGGRMRRDGWERKINEGTSHVTVKDGNAA